MVRLALSCPVVHQKRYMAAMFAAIANVIRP
jgi:hypothetical protein